MNQYVRSCLLRACVMMQREGVARASLHVSACMYVCLQVVQRLRITFSSDCAFCDKSTKIGTLVVLYI